jgi:hypothetical protein
MTITDNNLHLAVVVEGVVVVGEVAGGGVNEGNFIGGALTIPNVRSVKTFLRFLSVVLKRFPGMSGSLCLALVIVTSFRVWRLRLFRKAVMEKYLFMIKIFKQF